MCSAVWRMSSGRSEQAVGAFNRMDGNVMVDDAMGSRIDMELDFRSRDKRFGLCTRYTTGYLFSLLVLFRSLPWPSRHFQHPACP